MKLKLFLLLLLATVMPALAQNTGVAGKIVDSTTGQPIAGATVMLNGQNLTTTTGPNGEFIIPNALPGEDVLIIAAFGYNDLTQPINVDKGEVSQLGEMKIKDSNMDSGFRDSQQELTFDQSILDDDESSAQSISALVGASDNIYFNAVNYDFSIMRFRFRGYDSQYTTTYMNGVPLNDLARGRFNYSSLGGMNRAFRNRTNTMGMDPADYGFGNIGGSANINTFAGKYAPGFNGSVAFTNSNYMWRAMLMYSTGMNKHGWAVTAGAVGRYANEGIIEGTFYNSFGLFLSVEKMLNANNSLNLTVYGAPTQRATNSATFLEAYELTDNYLYNPNWGWQDGKKRSSKIINTFDPTAILNWLWKGKDMKTTVNTALAVRWVHYATSALSWYNSADPRADYYRRFPSFYKDDPEVFDLYTDLWKHDESFRQLDWDGMYQTNYLNNLMGESELGSRRGGSSYILEDRHSNQFNLILNSTLNTKLNDFMNLQAGATFNYTRASYFKTIRDLLGGKYWVDIDTYSERDFPADPDILQNNLNDPDRKVVKGDRFGYDYDINAYKGTLWAQNTINLQHWDINYGVEVNYESFQRDGKMRNGRAPNNSYGKGQTHDFFTASVKAGAVYKIDGRNFITAHASYGSEAPLFEYSYISPRIKDTTIEGLKAERILSGDISYVWNYRRFRGSVGGFWTEFYDQTERTSFYDDQYSTFMNYVLKGVRKCFKGIEIGMAYKLTPSLTLSAAGTFARYQYKNRPTGTRSYENGMMPDTTQTVYLKNFYVGGTPQTAVNVGIDWAAPKSWFFNVNASWMGDAYVNLSPVRHEALPNLWEKYPDRAELEAKMKSLADQDKLNNAFVLNASVGKLIYIARKYQLNLNLQVYNLLNNRKIQTYGYQQGRFDYTNYDATKYPNKYYYAQGIRVFINAGIRF